MSSYTPALDADSAQQLLDSIPHDHRGPGGAIAIVQDGVLLAQQVWGFADIDKRIPMTDSTIMPLCSITKQMIVAVILDLQRNPSPKTKDGGDFISQLDQALAEVLPENVGQGLNVTQMMNMQSGLRDYWVMTPLWGAHPEQRFSLAQDAPKAIERTRSFHFEPGTEYSYCNVNFYLLGRLLEKLTGETLDDLLRDRVFKPAGMHTAAFGPDTAKLPAPCVAYEGTDETGYFPAVTRIEWSGEAGVILSLKDMIAYEKFIHTHAHDPDSWYATVSVPPKFKDGRTAHYGHGQMFEPLETITRVGHSGGLRGFRLRRAYVADARFSTIVMFNHEIQLYTSEEYILRHALKLPAPPQSSVVPAAAWTGLFLDTDTQLSLTVKPGPPGQISIKYAGYFENLVLSDPTHAVSRDMKAAIDGDELSIFRNVDNRQIHAKRIQTPKQPVDRARFTGVYHSDEADSTFHCSDVGGVVYGTFEGFLGHGPAHSMRYLGDNVWVLVCARSMDAPAPGDWTMVFEMDNNGQAVAVTVGCWGARKIKYKRS